MFFYIVLTPISTTYSLWSTSNRRKYHQIDVYIYQCAISRLHSISSLKVLDNSSASVFSWNNFFFSKFNFWKKLVKACKITQHEKWSLSDILIIQKKCRALIFKETYFVVYKECVINYLLNTLSSFQWKHPHDVICKYILNKIKTINGPQHLLHSFL